MQYYWLISYIMQERTIWAEGLMHRLEENQKRSDRFQSVSVELASILVFWANSEILNFKDRVSWDTFWQKYDFIYCTYGYGFFSCQVLEISGRSVWIVNIDRTSSAFLYTACTEYANLSIRWSTDQISAYISDQQKTLSHLNQIQMRQWCMHTSFHEFR